MKPMRTIKRGSSFFLRGHRRRNGVSVDLTEETISARMVQILDEEGQRVNPATAASYTLDAVKSETETGVYFLQKQADQTQTWQLGVYATDVQFSNPNGPGSSDDFVGNTRTYYITVERDYS